MAVTTQTSTILTNLPKTAYDRKLLERALPLLVHGNWAMMATVSQGMKSLEKRRHERLTISNTPEATYSTGVKLTEGTTPPDSVDPANPTVVVLTPDFFGAFMQLADYLVAVSIDDIKAEYTELLGDHSGTSLDRITRNALIAGTNILYAGTATSVATVAPADLLAYNEILDVRRTMMNGNVKMIGGVYYAVISPESWQTLHLDPDVRNRVIMTEDKAFNTGNVPEIAGIRFVITSEAYRQAGALTTVHHSLFFGQDAYCIAKHAAQPLETITKGFGSSGTADPLDQRMTLGWKASRAVSILNQNFFVQLRHAVNT
jgi:N4-gp56 family major capsid protein